jgi:hypothetical protein
MLMLTLEMIGHHVHWPVLESLAGPEADLAAVLRVGQFTVIGAGGAGGSGGMGGGI